MRLWTIVLEISVLMAQFPSHEIARRSYEFRTLGLGYANLGGLLMSMGIPYDSAAGRALGGAVTALMTGSSYATSAEMAGELGAFPGYAENREAMVRVIRNHRRAAHGQSPQIPSPPLGGERVGVRWGSEARRSPTSPSRVAGPSLSPRRAERAVRRVVDPPGGARCGELPGFRTGDRRSA